MNFETIPEIVDGLPNLCGWEAQVKAVTQRHPPLPRERTPLDRERLQSAFAIALHMHQPLILDGSDLSTARLIGNLQYMMENQHIHGNHDAPAFASCYSRIAGFISELESAGHRPRIMLDYSGALLFGLRQMGRGDILENLKGVTQNERYWTHVEWLGTFWGHAVASSTPVPDLKLQLRAWQNNFAAIFGWQALERVRGFSPPEMDLPNHPDLCFAYVSALRQCGYDWLLVQEHSVEELDGSGLRERYLPRRLVARDTRGNEAAITALIKTQGSDTKLVGQMQPCSEAKGQHPRSIQGKRVPPLVLQISDGENGGVMMNEFPGNYKQAWHEIGAEGVVGLNGTEYLEMLRNSGITEHDFDPIQPLHQHALWARTGAQPTPEKVAQAIEEAKKSDHRFHMEGGSWTSNLSWVKNYANVLDPMNTLSAQFHEKLDGRSIDTGSQAYRNLLLYLLTSQTSCYRYWGQGRWTDYAREICRRGTDILAHDF
jgi:hypothetical protein